MLGGKFLGMKRRELSESMVIVANEGMPMVQGLAPVLPVLPAAAVSDTPNV